MTAEKANLKELNENIRPEIGRKIKLLRTGQDLTQTELALMCGYSDPTCICKIEKGSRGVPLARIERVCRALGITVNDLIDPTGSCTGACVKSASAGHADFVYCPVCGSGKTCAKPYSGDSIILTCGECNANVLISTKLLAEN